MKKEQILAMDNGEVYTNEEFKEVEESERVTRTYCGTDDIDYIHKSYYNHVVFDDGTECVIRTRN